MKFCLFALASALLLCAAASRNSSVQFVDVTQKAGISFIHHTGAQGKKLLPETMGAGCAFADLDGDGWADILFVNGKDWTPAGQHYYPALYRNNHNGTFTDITHGSGLEVEMYGMGVAVADYDNDGLPDIYITALEGDHLFHNEGHGHFRDVTAASGIRNANFGTSAAWFDYDRDGKADLIVANYVRWSLKTDIYCSVDGKTKAYCTPESYKGQSLRLEKGRAGESNQQVTRHCGLGLRWRPLARSVHSERYATQQTLP